MRNCQHQKDQPRGPVKVQVGKGVTKQWWGVCQEQKLIVGVGGEGGAVTDEPVLSAEAGGSPSEGGDRQGRPLSPSSWRQMQATYSSSYYVCTIRLRCRSLAVLVGTAMAAPMGRSCKGSSSCSSSIWQPGSGNRGRQGISSPSSSFSRWDYSSW